MKKQEEKKIVDLDEFDNTVSLWQLIKSGNGRGQKKLEFIVDSILNSKVEPSHKPFSMILSGTQGCSTHARCILRAIGLDFPYELPAQLLQSNNYEVHSFFFPSRMCDSYIISSASLLNQTAQKILYEVLSAGEYSQINYTRQSTEVISVQKPIILTTHNKDNIPKYLQEKIDHIVELESYTKQQLELLVLQRIKYANIDYAEEKVLQLIVEYGCEKLNIITRLLKSAITVMLADSRTVLTVEDVEKVMLYS